MTDITVHKLMAALHAANDERPVALSAIITVEREKGEPVQYVRIIGQLDVQRVVNLLNG